MLINIIIKIRADKRTAVNCCQVLKFDFLYYNEFIGDHIKMYLAESTFGKIWILIFDF